MTRRAAGRVVLDVPHLALGPGVVHLAGPVGAGKTTLLRLCATLLAPSTGRVAVGGHDAVRDGARARAVLGHMGHEPALPTGLSVASALGLHARMHGAGADAVGRALDACGIGHLGGRRVRDLSRGERALSDLARATLHAPRVLLLDEPVAHLDPRGRETVRGAVEAVRARGGLALVASHHDPGLPVGRTIHLVEGRVEGPA